MMVVAMMMMRMMETATKVSTTETEEKNAAQNKVFERTIVETLTVM
jgi:hypothetical protein